VLCDMQGHDEFQELCAGAAAGYLTSEEGQGLRTHLAICSVCREVMRQYFHLVDGFLPNIAAEETGGDITFGPNWSFARSESRLFEQINEEEVSRQRFVNVSKSADVNAWARAFSTRPGRIWVQVWASYAAMVLLSVAVCIGSYVAGLGRGTRNSQSAPSKVETVAGQEQFPQTQQAGALRHEIETMRGQLLQRGRTIATLRKEAEDRTAEANTARALAESLEAEAEITKSVLQKGVEDRAELTQELEHATLRARMIQTDLDSAQQKVSQDASRIADLETKEQTLIRELEEQNVKVKHEEDLLSHDRDIRELMGSRDLYIAEVFDVDKTGANTRPFGRVFYTKERSLVFYAYDLDRQVGAKNASTFQAWGRLGADRTASLNLGIFYIDNMDKRRWVLKTNDAKSLTQIDAVFVTVEPRGGSRKPSGQAFLFAYLKVDPNHP
jgi:hypothetical protein